MAGLTKEQKAATVLLEKALSKEQIIEDVLDQYERHLGFLQIQENSSGS